MQKHYIQSKILCQQRKAAAPNQGAAALFCSTKLPHLYGESQNFIISQHWGQAGKSIVFYNLLAKKHYFRLNRAETPFANVVLTEGKKTAPLTFQEVAV